MLGLFFRAIAMSAGAAVVPAALLSAQDSGTTSRWKKKFHAAPGDSSSPPRGIGGDAGQQEELLHSKRPLGFSRRLDFVSADAHASVSPRPSSLGEAPGEAGCFEFSCWTKTLKMPGQRETSLQREAASPRRPHERALEAGLSSPAPQPDSTGTRGAGDSSGGVAESALPRPPASPLSSSGTGAAAAENSASLSGDAAEAKTLGGGRASPASSSAPIRQTAASSSSSLSAPQPPPPQTRKSSQTAATVRTALAAKTSSLLQRKQQFYKVRVYPRQLTRLLSRESLSLVKEEGAKRRLSFFFLLVRRRRCALGFLAEGVIEALLVSSLTP